jgi:polyketide cyclase/dehydrase/lipid transport protein
MADWEFEHSAESEAPPGKIWDHYADVEQWSEWSKGVEESTLDGEFEAGSKGTTKPPNLPRTRFELIEVEPERRFVSQAKLPGGTLRLDHLLEPANGGSRITHKATLAGPLSFVWKPVVSRIVSRELPDGVERLAELAVEKEEEAEKEAEDKQKRKSRLREADEEFKAEIEKTSRGEGDQGGASVPGTG